MFIVILSQLARDGNQDNRPDQRRSEFHEFQSITISIGCVQNESIRFLKLRAVYVIRRRLRAVNPPSARHLIPKSG